MTDASVPAGSTPPGPRRWGRPGRWALTVSCALSWAGIGLIGTAVAGATPAAADPLAACSTTVGVVVAVDFSPWGQDIERGCDATVTTALAALQADFTVTGTTQYGLAFVCKIDSQPSDQACTETPPVSASWSFWYANVGQASWTYAPAGASAFQPQAGSVEAWTFGQAGAKPSFSPGAVRATNTDPVAPGPAPTTSAPTTTPSAPSTPTPTTPGGGGSSSPAGGGKGSPTPSGHGGTASPTTTVPSQPAGGSSTTTTVKSPTTPGGGATTTTPPGGPGGNHPKIVDAKPLSAQDPSTGSPVPLIVGSVLVVALAGAAGAAAWRRRRTG